MRFYRLHKLEHFPFLNFLHFEDIFQRDLIEVLPHVVHLVIRLGEICLENQTKYTTEQIHMRSNWGFVAFSPCVKWQCVNQRHWLLRIKTSLMICLPPSFQF